jgi:hypothetical protein
MQQFAPRHAVAVEDEQLEHLDIRILFKKGLGFLFRGEGGRGKTHGNSLICASGKRTGAAALIPRVARDLKELSTGNAGIRWARVTAVPQRPKG